MPGIFGVVDAVAPRAAVEALARRVGESLRVHPGLVLEVDGAAAGPAVLGRAHLGVLDREPAPVVAADGAVRLVIAGEVTDPPGGPAALAARYVARGPRALVGLSGSFALALWDGRARRLLLANDRFGLRNVYWTLAGDRFAFAPRAGALLVDPAVPRRVDAGAVAEFALFQCVLGEHTLLEGIRLLPPAALLAFEPGLGVRVERTWRLRYQPPVRPTSVDTHAHALAGVLRATVARQTEISARVGIPLSGGLDSRTLLAAAAAERRRPLCAITYGRPRCDDLLIAARLAELAGASHHTIPLLPGYIAAEARTMVDATDGMHSCANAHAALLREAAACADLILLGNGGDCLLDGLWTGPPDLDEDEVVARLLERIRIGLGAETLGRLAAPRALLRDVEERAAAGLRAALAAAEGASIADRVDAFNVVERHRRWVLQGVPAQATHVEFRHPYYADAVVEAALAVPAAYRLERRAHAAALAVLGPPLAAVRREGKSFGFAAPAWRREMDRVSVRLRGAVRWRANRLGLNPLAARPNRRSFTDVGDELRHGSRGLLADVLLAPPALERGWWKPDAVRALVAEHVGGRANHGAALGILVTLELFARRTLDGERWDVSAASTA